MLLTSCLSTTGAINQLFDFTAGAVNQFDCTAGSINQLFDSTAGAINQLFDSMEKKFGRPLVQHSLAYLTASRHGLSEVELEHLMSLDDELLNHVYKFWRPPLRRVPPLLWTRIRAEVSTVCLCTCSGDLRSGGFHLYCGSGSGQRWVRYCVSVYKFWRPPLRRVPTSTVDQDKGRGKIQKTCKCSEPPVVAEKDPPLRLKTWLLTRLRLFV